MLRLSECLGGEVTDTAGNRVGRLVDLEVTLEEEHPPVRALLVRRRRGDPALVPWTQVSSFEPSGVVVEPGSGRAAGEAEETLRLARDVLDAQVVDVAGRRVRRVSDVDLARTEDGLRAVAVDVGWAGVARRLGLRRRGGHAHRDLIDWTDLHLASSRGHRLQLRTSQAALHRLSPGDLAELVARLPPARAAEALDAVDEQRAAAALSATQPKLGGRLLGALPEQAAARVLSAMPVDDAVAALRHVEYGRRGPLLERVPAADERELRSLLAYPSGTAGGSMTTNVRTAPVAEPPGQTLRRLADDPPALEGLFTVLVVDDDGRLVGVRPPSALIAGRNEPLVLPVVHPDTPLERVIEIFARYDVVAVPVVDDENRPLGAVAIDDLLEELLAERLPRHRRRYRMAFGKQRGQA